MRQASLPRTRRPLRAVQVVAAPAPGSGRGISQGAQGSAVEHAAQAPPGGLAPPLPAGPHSRQPDQTQGSS